MELGELKMELDDAINAGRMLQNDIRNDPRYEMAETIQEKKQ